MGVILENRKRVGMGEIIVRNHEHVLSTTVGSCIAACVYDYKNKLGGMAHVVLPRQKSKTKQGSQGKFADIAIPLLLSRMKTRGSKVHQLKVKIAGGGNMFPQLDRNVLNIGDDNIRAVIHSFQKEGLSITSKDVGGTQGRKIDFDLSTGVMTIDRLKGETIEI